MKTTFLLTRKVHYFRWVARILGTLLVVIFLFFFIPDIIKKGGLQVSDAGHWVMLIFFLLGQVGLLIAWRWEGIGGMLAAIGIVLSFLINFLWVHEGQNQGFVLIWLLPAFLFLYCWWQTGKQPKQDGMDR